MSPREATWFDVASAAPLAATASLGLGPFRGYGVVRGKAGGRGLSRLPELTESEHSSHLAANCAGVIGMRVLSVLLWHGGSATREVLADETSRADPTVIDDGLDRLVSSGLVQRSGDETLRLDPAVAQVLAPIGRSLADQYATTVEELAGFCKNLGISPMPGRKQERIDAIERCFTEADSAARVRDSLSKTALSLLDRVAARNGPRVTDAMSVGLSDNTLRRARVPLFGGRGAHAGLPDGAPQEAKDLAELKRFGIVDFDEWENTLWIWREAWPLCRRPLFTSLPEVDPPATAPVDTTGMRLPSVVATFDRALRHWDQSPPAVLRSGEMRLGKPVLRSTAKTLGVDEGTADIIARAALSLGLMLPNVVATSGRGRKRTTTEKWLGDPELQQAWFASDPSVRWLRIVAEWVNPADTDGVEQLVANRHLLLWELAALEEGLGWCDDDDEVGRWMQHRYAPMAVDEAIIECLRDLRTLGIVTTDGPAALTGIGRLALEDPKALDSLEFGSATEAIVQADMSIICPPDMDLDVLTRIEALATLESDHGTRSYTLDESLVVDAVRSGDTAEGIVSFLEDLSSVRLPDTVYRLITDAAQRVGRVRLSAATSVVVTDDPVDLATACKLKSAKLTALTDTVAVSSLPVEKLSQILDRKGLAPTVTGDGNEKIVPRSTITDAEELERRAKHQREVAERMGHRALAAQAELYERQVKAARDPASKLKVTGPLAVTPSLLAKVKR